MTPSNQSGLTGTAVAVGAAAEAGAAAGVTLLLAGEGALLPTPFVAATVNV